MLFEDSVTITCFKVKIANNCCLELSHSVPYNTEYVLPLASEQNERQSLEWIPFD